VRAREAARRWAETWTHGWEQLDPDRVVALYAPDAVHFSQPFREAGRGIGVIRAYVVQAFAEEARPRVWMGEPIVDGDRAAIAWWAALDEDGAPSTLAGTSLLRFDSDGMVIEQWDAWNQAAERLAPPDASPFGVRDT
jgi:ketosteroid isomerase-like protein